MRKIIHLDMDCFYAAIEMRERPELREKPLAVGGAVDRRGVLTTCNYPARRFGVRSAMPTYLALRKCPDLVVLPTRFDLYRKESHRIREILLRTTRVIEPLSLDEAYLDVTADARPGTEIAETLREEIRERTALTASAGIAPNKLLAKIASDWHKPDGQFEVKESEVGAFIADLPVRKIQGIGKVTAEKLDHRGVKTCGDLQRYPAQELFGLFGKFGGELYELCRGIDRRPVEPDRPRKSLSTEQTFSHNLEDPEACREALDSLYAELIADLKEKARDRRIQKLFVKIKFSDFTRTTVERNGTAPDPRACRELLDDGLRRRRLPVRLLGVGVRFADEEAARQLELDFAGTPDRTG